MCRARPSEVRGPTPGVKVLEEEVSWTPVGGIPDLDRSTGHDFTDPLVPGESVSERQ